MRPKTLSRSPARGRTTGGFGEAEGGRSAPSAPAPARRDGPDRRPLLQRRHVGIPSSADVSNRTITNPPCDKNHQLAEPADHPQIARSFISSRRAGHAVWLAEVAWQVSAVAGAAPESAGYATSPYSRALVHLAYHEHGTTSRSSWFPANAGGVISTRVGGVSMTENSSLDRSAPATLGDPPANRFR